MRRKDPHGQVHGYSTRETSLELTMDRQGRVEVRIGKRSGLDFLDDEAVRATLAAAPFTNPPAALFDGQPTITFRFGFILTMERPNDIQLVPTWRRP
jgi:TonB family protein